MNNIITKPLYTLEIEKDVRTVLRVGMVLFLFIQLALLIYFQEPLLIASILLVILLGVFFFRNSELIFYIMICYISIVPTVAFKPGFFPLYSSFNILLIFILLIAIQLIFSTENSLKRKTVQFSLTDIILLLFLSWIIISIVYGFSMNPKKTIIKEANYIFLFSFYWWVTKLKAKQEWVKKFAKFYVILTTIVSIEFIFFVVRAMDIKSMLFNRVVTQQPFLALFTVPLLISYSLINRRLFTKFGILLLVIINVISVVLSQWRALTGGLIVSIFSFFIIFSFRNGINHESWRTIARISAVVILIITIVFFFSIKYIISLDTIESLFKRYKTFQSVIGDPSWNMRSSGIKAALFEWRISPVIGRGFGNNFDPKNIFVVYNNQLDNSYIYLLWKTGIIGVGLLLIFFSIILRHAFILISRLPDSWNRYYVCSVFSGFIGLMLSSYFYLSLMRYRFIIFWAIFLGTIEVLYHTASHLESNV